MALPVVLDGSAVIDPIQGNAPTIANIILLPGAASISSVAGNAPTIATAASSEAYGYVYENVGTNTSLGQPDENNREGYGWIDENVGVNNNAGGPDFQAQEAYGYLYENVGVDPRIADEAYGYQYFGDVDTSTPTPHIWYLFRDFGREGDGFSIVGHGFGEDAGEFDGEAFLGIPGLSIVSWERVPGDAPRDLDATREITPIDDVATPEHQRIETVVPVGAISANVIVRTDGP